MIKTNLYSGFIKLLLFSFIISLIIVAFALLMSIKHPRGEIVDARIQSQSLSIKLKKPWNPGLFSDEVKYLSGVCDNNGNIITQVNNSIESLKSLDFKASLPINTTINMRVVGDEYILLIEMPENSDFDCSSRSLVDDKNHNNEQIMLAVSKESKVDDEFSGLKKRYFSFGRRIEMRLNYSVDSTSDQFSLLRENKNIYSELPPVSISRIGFPFEINPSSRQQGTTKQLLKNSTSLLNGEVNFPASEERSFIVKRGDPIRFHLEAGILQTFQVTNEGLNIHFIAKVDSVEKLTHNFSKNSAGFKRIIVSPTWLDKLTRSDFFIYFLSIVGFVLSMAGLFELLDIKDVFRRNINDDE